MVRAASGDANSGRAGIAQLHPRAIQRLIFETGRPFEMIAMHSLRDLVLGLAAAACWRQFQRITVLMSLFLILFSAAIARDRVVAVLCATYGILCLATLGATYWETLRPRLLAQDQARSSRRWILIGASLLILTALTQTPAGKPLMRVMQGIVPSSGGDWFIVRLRSRWGRRRRDLVAGMDDIRTFGPIEDAPFISDHKPSLYDVFDDRYDEPSNSLRTRIARSPVCRTGCEDSGATPQGQSDRPLATSRSCDSLGKVRPRRSPPESGRMHCCMSRVGHRCTCGWSCTTGLMASTGSPKSCHWLCNSLSCGCRPSTIVRG